MREFVVGLAVAGALAGAAQAETLPEALANSVGNDPKSSTPECQAAIADARAWSEGGLGDFAKGVGRVVIWPFGERSAHRRSEAENSARERVMERVRQSCFTQPAFERAAPSPYQRWPGGRGYDRSMMFTAQVGGRRITGQVHPTAKTILLRTAEGGPGHMYWKGDDWARVAAWYIEPSGCRLTEDQQGPGATWEVGYVCPAGVDLREVVRRQSGAGRLSTGG